MSQEVRPVPANPAARLEAPRVGVRFGLKGGDAPAWLERHGIPVPDAPNRIAHWQAGRCLRLGHGEFLIEMDEPGPYPLAGDTGGGGTAHVWPLLRSDHSLLLTGSAWPALLAQVCSFDFRRFRDEPGLAVMTLMAGIAVTVVAERPAPPASVAESAAAAGDAPAALRLWCDASYAGYLDHCLQTLAAPSSQGDRR